jgi:hypothetical protein
MNIRRSGDTVDSIDLLVDLETPRAVLEQLHKRVVDYCASHPRDFHISPDFVLTNLDLPSHTLKISIWAKHTSNFQDGTARWTRRNMLVAAIKDAICELGIKGSGSNRVLVPPLKP